MPTLNERIRHFYDRSTGLWLDAWGEHMHHGYYGPQGLERKSHPQAQLDLIDELLTWGGVTHLPPGTRILDAGCGVGGSARYLARRFPGTKVLGLTLSPVQVLRGRRFNQEAGLDDRLDLEARDMLMLNEADGPFDLIWSLESAEHLVEKQQLFETFYRVLAPGGRLLMATWCRRPTPPTLTAAESVLLDRLCHLYHLAPFASRPDLMEMAARSGFNHLESADWSAAVAPFWQAVRRSALRLQNLAGLLRAGWPAIRGAWAMQYMMEGYAKGLIEFAVLRAQKQ